MDANDPRLVAANSWNHIMIGFLIEHMKHTASALERFESLGGEAYFLINDQITALEKLRKCFEKGES